jgi:hypothetical protein
MGKKKDKKEKKNKEEEVVEEVILEEEMDEATEDGGERSWTEEFEVAGEELISFLQNLYNEVNVRRIMVKNADDRVLLDIPVAVGLVGFFPPLLMYTAVALGAAVLTNCTITVERVETDDAPAEKEAAE